MANITLRVDKEANALIARVRTHLPEGTDLTLITLKGHLLLEEAIDNLIRSYCTQPELLNDAQFRFADKVKLAKALSGHLTWTGLWTLSEALNKVRNELAHNLDSPKLHEKVQRFMRLRRELAPVLSDPEDCDCDISEVPERFRADVSLLVSQAIGAGSFVRMMAKRDGGDAGA
jgi:hypothetical protein